MDKAVEDVRLRMLSILESGVLTLPAFLEIVADVSAYRGLSRDALMEAVRLALGDRFRIVASSR